MSALPPVPRPPSPNDPEDDALLDEDEADEEILDEDPDHPMEEEDDEDLDREEIQLQNDSIAHFDAHTDSIFCIAQHPINPNIVITGGGDDLAYLFDTSLPEYSDAANSQGERASIKPLQKLDGHTDSVNAVTFTYPKGDYVATAGLDGKIRTYRTSSVKSTEPWSFVAEAAEVEEINWLHRIPQSRTGKCNCPGRKRRIGLGLPNQYRR